VRLLTDAVPWGRRARESPWALTVVFVAAIAVGSLGGAALPAAGGAVGGWVDATVMTLVCLLFFELRFSSLGLVRTAPRFLAVAWAANFVVIPLVGFCIASLFLSGEPLLFTGLLIYFVAPCTDWFLGFTRLSGGNTALGVVLLPVNLISQLVLYPVFLTLFARTGTTLDGLSVLQTVVLWFVAPLLVMAAARLFLQKVVPPAAFRLVTRAIGVAIPTVIAVLILELFAANIATILGHATAFAVILAAVAVFFGTTYLVGELLARLFRFGYPDRALLAMTTAARNAPLMLAITTIALPGQPLVYAAIIIGMLVEFPHLTVVRQLLLRAKRSDTIDS
jgi:ACR3 family arsenite transporter